MTCFLKSESESVTNNFFSFIGSELEFFKIACLEHTHSKISEIGTCVVSDAVFWNLGNLLLKILTPSFKSSKKISVLDDFYTLAESQGKTFSKSFKKEEDWLTKDGNKMDKFGEQFNKQYHQTLEKRSQKNLFNFETVVFNLIHRCFSLVIESVKSTRQKALYTIYQLKTGIKKQEFIEDEVEHQLKFCYLVLHSIYAVFFEDKIVESFTFLSSLTLQYLSRNCTLEDRPPFAVHYLDNSTGFLEMINESKPVMLNYTKTLSVHGVSFKTVDLQERYLSSIVKLLLDRKIAVHLRLKLVKALENYIPNTYFTKNDKKKSKNLTASMFEQKSDTSQSIAIEVLDKFQYNPDNIKNFVNSLVFAFIDADMTDITYTARSTRSVLYKLFRFVNNKKDCVEIRVAKIAKFLPRRRGV